MKCVYYRSSDIPGGPYSNSPFHGDRIPLNNCGYYIWTYQKQDNNKIIIINIKIVFQVYLAKTMFQLGLPLSIIY